LTVTVTLLEAANALKVRPVVIISDENFMPVGQHECDEKSLLPLLH
jgi:hypothetical protein